jgi:hypothetical protein
MTDIRANARRARELEFNLTGEFSHQQAVQLAELWLPEIRFHEEERFHPVDLEQLFKAPVEVFEGLPPPAREAFLITVSGPAGDRHFTPPVVRNGSTVLLHGGEIDQDLQTTPDGTEKLLDGVDENTLYSHGKSLTRSTEFFGASDTVSGNTVPQPGDPRVPAHPIVVRAEMRFLRDALRHHLQEDPPADSLWGWFDVESEIIRSPEPGHPQDREVKLDILRDLLAGFEAEDLAAQAAAIQRITQRPGWSLHQRAWDAVRFYAFLEFYFVYAYNDYPDYGDWPFVNEHEGDVEGCCVVFDRRDLDQVAARAKPIEDVIAHTVITSVHEPFNDNDELKRLPVERDRARDDLVVYVAPGSHATYLSAGTHDVLDWEDILTDWPGQVGGWQEVVLALLYPAIFPLLLMAAITEHFVDAEDETTDDGVRTGPDSTTPVGGTSFAHELIVTPLSRIGSPPDGDPGDFNLYQAGFEPPEHGLDPCELARRAYRGKWGAHEGTPDRSSQWEDKTARYFRKFVASGEITGDVIL